MQFHIITKIQRLFRHFLQQSYHGVERVNCTIAPGYYLVRVRAVGINTRFSGSATFVVNVIDPPSLPTPTGITFVTTTTSLPDISPAGTTVATFFVSMSDGSAFSGTLGASPVGTVAISGSTRLLVMAWSPPAHKRRIVWVSAPGDYATFNSNQTPDGTKQADPVGELFLPDAAKGRPYL